MVGTEDLDGHGTLGHFGIEDGLSVEGAVVIAHSGMVAANDKVGGAHVLTEIGVEHGFTRTGIEHVETVTGDHGAIGREIQLDHLADRGIAYRRRDIALLELAQQHVNDQAVAI